MSKRAAEEPKVQHVSVDGRCVGTHYRGAVAWSRLGTHDPDDCPDLEPDVNEEEEQL